MKNINEINIRETFISVKDAFNRTTKKQRILFVVGLVLLLTGFVFCKDLWQKYTISRQAKKIVTKITQAQKEFLKKDSKYKKDIFADAKFKSLLKVSPAISKSGKDLPKVGGKRKKDNKKLSKEGEDYTIGQSGDFYIENDADNGCVVLKYKRNTTERTTFYASFKDGGILCQGKKCLKEAKNNEADLCYKDGMCFHKKQKEKTERPCGDGNGLQKRKCLPSCENGTCEEWGQCECKKGFEWSGTTCKQSQTEKDCSKEQCFNGIYCEDKDKLEKQIENGSCKRRAVCQKKAGWQYTPWECFCDTKDFCPLKEECIVRPENEEEINLPDEEGSCKDIHYECREEQGWIGIAKNCTCEKIGTFWNIQEKEVKCSPCTKKPVGAVYTSAGGNKDNCSWICDGEYQARKGTCLKPNGQYLCAKTDLHICTDEFSRSRKLQKDAQKTNEGQPCYVEDKDNILYYNQKEKTCQICQCVDLTTGKTSN